MNRQGYYVPTLTNLSASFTPSQVNQIDAIALQAPVAWPYPRADQPGQQLAFSYISAQTCRCPDVRAAYGDLNNSLADWYTQLALLKYPGQQSGFSPSDFDTIQKQLLTELFYAADIQRFEINIIGLYTAQNSNVGLILTSDYADVANSLPMPANTDSVFLDVLGGIFNLARSLPVGPVLQVTFAAANVAIDFGTELVNNSDGTPALQRGQLRSTYGHLAGDAANLFAQGQYEIGNLFALILTDWGRMQKLGGAIAGQQLQWDPRVDGEVLGSFDRSTRT
ncbi:MAG: hypothetical protein ACLQU2_32890, partial [Candidatus Binataceae bacterium]